MDMHGANDGMERGCNGGQVGVMVWGRGGGGEGNREGEPPNDENTLRQDWVSPV